MSPCHLTAIRKLNWPMRNGSTKQHHTNQWDPDLKASTLIGYLYSPLSQPQNNWNRNQLLQDWLHKNQTNTKTCPEPSPDPGSLPLKGSKHLVQVWPQWRKDLSHMVWQDGIKSSIKFIYTIVIALYVYIIFHLKYILVLLLHRILLLQPMFV